MMVEMGCSTFQQKAVVPFGRYYPGEAGIYTTLFGGGDNNEKGAFWFIDHNNCYDVHALRHCLGKKFRSNRMGSIN